MFINFLRISYNHIHLPSLNSSDLPPFPNLWTLGGGCFSYLTEASFSCPNPQVFGHPQEHGWPTRSDTLKENWLFLPRRLCAHLDFVWLRLARVSCTMSYLLGVHACHCPAESREQFSHCCLWLVQSLFELGVETSLEHTRSWVPSPLRKQLYA